MNCETCHSKMLEYLYEELDAPERQEFEAALAACPECETELAALRQTTAAYDNLAPLEVPGKLRADIMRAARLHADVLARQSVPWWKRVLSPPMMLASATVAAAALAAVFIAQPPATNDTPNIADTAGAESVAAVSPDGASQSEMAPPSPTVPHGAYPHQLDEEYPHQLGIERSAGSATVEPSVDAPSTDRDENSELVNDQGLPVELAADYQQMIRPDLDVVGNAAFNLGRSREGTQEQRQQVAEQPEEGELADPLATSPARNSATESPNGRDRADDNRAGDFGADGFSTTDSGAEDSVAEDLLAEADGVVGDRGSSDRNSNSGADNSNYVASGEETDEDDDNWGGPTDRVPGANSGFGIGGTGSSNTGGIAPDAEVEPELGGAIAPSNTDDSSQPYLVEEMQAEAADIELADAEPAVAAPQVTATQGTTVAAAPPVQGWADNTGQDDEMVAVVDQQTTPELNDAEEEEEEEVEENRAAEDAAESSFRQGLASYASGDYEAAVSYLQASLAAGITGRNEAEAQYHLGAAYFRLGNYSRARTELTAFISDNPDHAYVDDAQQLIDEARDDQEPNRRYRDNNEMIDFADEAYQPGSR